MKYIVYLLVFLSFLSCNNLTETREQFTKQTQKVSWKAVDTIDIAGFNSDIEPGKPTLDVAVYYPSNFDPAFKKVTLARMMESIQAAKAIYKPTGVQINLLWVKTGELNPDYFSIQANEVPGIPETEYANTYVNMRRHPAELTERTKQAFTSIIEPDKQNSKTIYLIALQDVFYPFLEVSEGRNWTMKTVRTGGMSFPGYSYCSTLPDNFRGIITITNLARPDRYRKTVAHEIGHKVMNVGHEFKTTNPGFEVFAEGGLMLYGKGEEIPSGKEGRWHLERLHLSPFIYRLQDGRKVWNPEYKEGGHYYDPIYGNKVIHFEGKSEIDENW
ncbi:protein of unknown function [Daejeonella rubra]|uniref:IrrE N-terminal-like domain-containing protein n=1 Tax=Daejeonella rubra TaxID=990371 RepID=A0A1G9YPX1_9SPHI|nr:hypothetical protein [Daejeonella rubra]SDN11047.1 protein of unknown function [Daejeonella rubra]